MVLYGKMICWCGTIGVRMSQNKIRWLLGCLAFYLSGSISFAASLSVNQFDKLARACVPVATRSVLRAVARIESDFNPFSVHNNTKRLSATLRTLGASAAQANAWIAEGDSVDLGLMQINSANLPRLGITVAEAFDPCHSLQAGERVLAEAYARDSSAADRQAALLIALSRYNTGNSLAGLANDYVGQILSARSGGAGAFSEGADESAPQPAWNIWGTSAFGPASWLITAKRVSEIERAGAQTSDARNEGRAPASSSEKGEPYELFAYQENEPNRP